MTRSPMGRQKRVTVVTAGHLSTCPRMLKAADALQAAGYRVRVVATRHEPWASETDRDVRTRRSWPLTVVNYRRDDSGLTYWRSGVRHRAARATAKAVGVNRLPFEVVARAFARVHSELVAAVCAEPADFIYGGTTGALAAVAESARRQKIPYGVDLEDLHSGEASGPDAPTVDALAARVELEVLRQPAFATTSSEAIALEYRRLYGVSPAVVHNTFPLPGTAPDFQRANPAILRLYWFSQTIGEGRGLEDAIRALGRTGGRAEVTLRGRPKPGYFESLSRLAAVEAPAVSLVHEPPACPDAMIDLSRGFDIGLALEQTTPRNRQLAVSNKALTYILAGVAVAMTDTAGQHRLGVDLGRGAALVPPGDIGALADAFGAWMRDPAGLEEAKRAAWAAAARRWHWEHDLERGALCALVAQVLS